MATFAAVGGAGLGCGSSSEAPKSDDSPPEVDFATTRDPCVDRQAHRRALFGDLHVHTHLSFDAGAYDTRLSASDAYLFARGEAVLIPPLDADGGGTRRVQLDRPLDFAAVTDHAEFLGEISQCTTRGAPGYDSSACRRYRDPETNGALQFGQLLGSFGKPTRLVDLCGPDGTGCRDHARRRWADIQIAAEEAYDRTSECRFTSLVGYEYTNTRGVSNLHRNVVFGTSRVPELPVSLFEANSPLELWRKLDSGCLKDTPECDVMSIPHNSNLSNGQLFHPDYTDAATLAEEREIAELRARMEPIVEVFQHKGDSECRNGFDNGAEPDPKCDFEKLRTPGAELCGPTPGSGGMRLLGCVHELDFVRNTLKAGLLEERRLGANPYPLGFIASTDTHNAIPGYVDRTSFLGHIGSVDATPEERLGEGNVTHDGIINNPGGLAGVWAEENSRPAIFAALRRRETFATSGPRIEPRFFAGELPRALCDAPPGERLEAAYENGVPMGGTVRSVTSPRFLIDVKRDPAGMPLSRLQVVKGWIDDTGSAHERVIDVAVHPDAPAQPKNEGCDAVHAGYEQHCTVWEDPDWNAERSSFYYLRVLEVPSCRWSARQCDALGADRPETCDAVPRWVEHRAWSSPIWFSPE